MGVTGWEAKIGPRLAGRVPAAAVEGYGGHAGQHQAGGEHAAHPSVADGRAAGPVEPASGSPAQLDKEHQATHRL